MGFTAGLMSSLNMGVPKYFIDDGICTDCEACQQGLDVAFAMDYTGSMGGIIESVKSDIGDIAATIDSLVDPANKYRLSLQLTDEATFNGTTYAGISYPTSGVYTGLPAAQKFAEEGTHSYASPNELRQLLTTMEPFADNNLSSFQTQLAKTNNNTAPNMGLGWGVGGAEPYDMSIDRIIDGDVGIGTWRKAVSRIGITFADNAPGGDDDNFGTADQSFMLDDLSSKCRINNIRWMRFGPNSNNYKWRELGVRTGGTNNNSYNKSVVNAAIIAACAEGEVPYRMIDSNGDLKTDEFTPYSWHCGITGGASPTAHYLEIADHNDFTIDPSVGITFSLWIKPQDDEFTNQKYFHKTGEYEIGTDSNNKLFFSITTNNGTLKITTTTSPLTSNWQHLLCTWDGTFANANGLKIYWAAGSANGAGASHTIYSNGNSNVSDESTGSTGTSITNTSNSVQCSTNNTTTAGADTLLSDVAIYKNDVSASQAALILNNGRPGNLHDLWNSIDKYWLVGYWRPFSPLTIATGGGGCTVYGWESKNAIFYGKTVGSDWSTDVPSSLGQ